MFHVVRRVTAYCALAVLVSPASAAVYSLTDLGTLPTNLSSFAMGVNNGGQAAGYSNDGGNVPHAYRYNAGAMQNLHPAGFYASWGYGINSSGQVVGSAEDNNSRAHAMLFNINGAIVTTTDLGTFGGDNGVAWDINNAGHVVGVAEYANSIQRAFVWLGGSKIDLGTLKGPGGSGTAAGHSRAVGINNSGLIVGFADSSTGYAHAFLYTPGGSGGAPANPQMKDLGTFGGLYSYAWDVNDLGQIAGSATIAGPPLTSTPYHAFRYSNGAMTDLGTLGGNYSEAYSINKFGMTVGTSAIATEVASRAFLSDNGPMQDLNDLLVPGTGWTLLTAWDINDLGLIVGYGRNPQNQFRAFLLTPDTLLPEPGGGACVVAWALALWLPNRVRSRRRH